MSTGNRLFTLSALLLLLLSLVGCEVTSNGTGAGYAPGEVSAPVFSPTGGSYVGPQEVTISAPTAGSVVRYTLDYSTPTTTHGIIYDTPVTISSTSALKAIAFLDNRESPVTIASYVIAPINTNHAPTAAGLSATVYPAVPHSFTLQGSDPDGDALTFAVTSQPLHGTLSGTAPNLTYTADVGYQGDDSFTFTVSDGEFTSAAATVTFTVLPQGPVAAPVFSPDGGTFQGNRVVTLTSATSGAAIRYTLDGSLPTATSGTVYNNGSFNLTASATVKAVAYKYGVVSPVSEAAFTILPNTPDINLNLLTPKPDAMVSDSVFVAASIWTAFELDSVTASSGNRSVGLVFKEDVYCDPPSDVYHCVDGFGGNLDLSGLPVGEVEIKVEARDHFGGIAAKTVTVRHDAPPTLTILAPASGSTAHPNMRFAATCTDDGGPGCEIHVSSLNEVTVPNLVPPAFDSLDAVGDLSAYSGKTLYVRFTASDKGGNVVLREFTIVQVEGAQNLDEVLSLDGKALDVNETTALALIETPQGQILKTTNRQTLATAEYPLPQGYAVAGDNAVKFAHLTPLGAIAVIYRPAFLDYKVMSWENGVAIDLGPIESYSSLKVAGGYAIWNNFGNLYRREFATGETVPVATNAGNWQNDVAENGAVAYWTSDNYSLHLFDGPTLLVADQYRNVYPRTDGQLTAYLKDTGSLSAIAMHDGQAETLLTDFSQAYVPPDGYQVAGGVVYYTKPGSLGQKTVWRRIPDGTQTKLTFFTTDALLDRAGADGTAMAVNGSDRYLVGLDASLTKVSGGLGRTLQLGGQWYLLLGDWVARYK